MKNNNIKNNFYKIYFPGFLIILALPVLVTPSLFFPADWGKGIVFRSILAIILFLFIFQILYKKNEINLPDIKKTGIIIWLLMFYFAVILLSTLFSPDINFSLWGSPYRAQGAINFFFYIILSILSFLIIKPGDWNKLLNMSIFIGILVSLIAIIQFYGLFNYLIVSAGNRPPSTMGNPIMLGIYLVLLIFIALSCFINEKRYFYKIFYALSVILFFIVILITGSRAAYLGLLFGAIFFILFYPSKAPQNTLTPQNLQQKSQIPASKTNFFSKILNLPFSKKIFALKIITIITLVLMAFLIFYVNTNAKFLKSLENNKLLWAIGSRLSIDMFIKDPRYSAWQIIINVIKEKPILGWGPENLAIGFDKHYDPTLPYISKTWGGWWDRSHNVLLDIAATTGVLSLIIYLAIFIALIWQLEKTKRKTENKSAQIIAHGIQATLIAYLVANFFSFDGFSSYLLFYFIIGYSIFLIYSNKNKDKDNPGSLKQIRGKGIMISILFIFLLIFLWQYNFLPLQINKEINNADNLAEKEKCEESFSVSENLFKKRSFLDAYIAIHYIDNIKSCAAINPDKNLEYAERGSEILKNAIKIRPAYSRFWLFLGGFTTIKAAAEKNTDQKELLMQESGSYLKTAEELAPFHTEVIIEQAKLSMVSRDYEKMAEKAQRCIELEPELAECYWIKIMSEAYLKKTDQAEKDFQTFIEKYGNISITYLYQLANIFTETNNYQNLAIIYQEIIRRRPDVAQNYASLAFVYSKLGKYNEAKKQALKFLELMPEAEEEVNAFLKTLPY